jgi:hypothetical protein
LLVVAAAVHGVAVEVLEVISLVLVIRLQYQHHMQLLWELVALEPQLMVPQDPMEVTQFFHLLPLLAAVAVAAETYCVIQEVPVEAQVPNTIVLFQVL